MRLEIVFKCPLSTKSGHSFQHVEFAKIEAGEDSVTLTTGFQELLHWSSCFQHLFDMLSIYFSQDVPTIFNSPVEATFQSFHVYSDLVLVQIQ